MSNAEYYAEQAEKARRDAADANLDNVRDRCLRSAEAWDDMATRAARTSRMRAETEKRKSEAQAASG
jgi:hypothetical protein